MFTKVDSSETITLTSQRLITYICFRSIADGQSHYSFSNQSHRGYLNSGFPSHLVSSRPGKVKFNIEVSKKKKLSIQTELRQSRTSLAAASERLSRASYTGSFHGGPQSVASSTRRARPRSRSRDQLNTTHLNRPGSRLIIIKIKEAIIENNLNNFF